MSEAISVPVVFVSEPIVLPTMVVPIELDDAARTAVDAAQASESGKLLIAPRLDDYMGGVFEQVCRQAVRAGGLEIPLAPVRVGEWWDAGSREQVDVVALDGDGGLFAAECKWGPATMQDLITLERRAGFLAAELGGIRRTHLALFSARGMFDDGIIVARDAGRVLCYTATDLM